MMSSEETVEISDESASDLTYEDDDMASNANEFEVDYFFNMESEQEDDGEESYYNNYEYDRSSDEEDESEDVKEILRDGVSFYFYSFENQTFTKPCKGECRRKQSDANKDDIFNKNNKLRKKRLSGAEQLNIRKPIFSDYVEDANPVVDGFICCHGNYNTYAKTVRTDMETLLFSCEQISILYEHNYLIRRKIGNTLKVVATPDMIRNVYNSKQPLTLYSLVGCLPKGEIIFPVADKLLRHIMSSFIESFLNEIKIHCREHKQSWALCQRIITDVDYEVISAVLSHFNEMNIVAYLKLCYNMFFTKKGQVRDNSLCWPKNLVCVQFSATNCSQMMMHEVRHWVGEKRPKLQDFLINSLRILFNLFKMSHCIIWFRRICAVLLSPQWTKRVEDAYNALVQHPRRMGNMNLISNDYVTSPTVVKSLKKLRTSCKSSPFKERFIQYYLHCRMQCIKDTMEADPDTSMPTKNVYYCPKVVKLIMDNCVAMLPFWSNIVGIKIEPNQFHTEQDEMIVNFYSEMRSKHLGSKRLELGQFIRGYGDFVERQIEDLRNFY